ncbi:hypothetical protein ACSBO6_10530 [Bacillus sp. AL-1R]
MKRFATYYPYDQKLVIENHHKHFQSEMKTVQSFTNSRLLFDKSVKEIGKNVILIGLGVGLVGLLVPTSKLFLYQAGMIIGNAFYHAIDWVHYEYGQHIHNLSSIKISSGHFLATIDPQHTIDSPLPKDRHYLLEKIDGKMKNHFEGVKDFLERNK